MDLKEITLLEKEVPGALLAKDPGEYSVAELRRWLECHGAKKTGKKEDLIARVRGCLERNTRVDPKVDGGKWYNLKKKGVGLMSPSLSGIIEIPSNGWRTFPSVDVPDMFNYGHVYHYLIQSVEGFMSLGCNANGESDSETEADSGYTSTARPLRKGHNLVHSDFVENMQDNKEEKYYFLRAHVHHSMKTDFPLAVSIVLDNISGSVRHGECNCKASALGRCAHVSAVLLKLVQFLDTNDHKVSALPSTSQPCQWNRGKKRKKNPGKVHNSACWPKESQSKLHDWDPRPINCRVDICDKSINSFITSLQGYSCKTGELSMWESTLQLKYKDYTLDDGRKLVLKTLVLALKGSLKNIFGTSDALNMCKEIPGTQQQQNSTAWLRERMLRITASKCKSAFACAEKLMTERKGGSLQQVFNWLKVNLWFPPYIASRDVAYGISMEPKAREAYTSVTGHSVIQSGMWVCNRCPYLGASPDGIILDTMGNAIGILEIKCLKIFREKSIEQVIEEHKNSQLSSAVYSRQCFKIESNKLTLKETHAFFYQMQLQLLLTAKNFCDFVLYSGKGPPYIQRIPRDENLQSKIEKTLSVFWHQVFIPEYFEMRVPRKLYPFIVS